MKNVSAENQTKPCRTRVKKANRILVVEDNDAIREACSRVLKDSGYEVNTADNGATAWEALQGERYSLVITDNNMPEMSGLELIHKLRSAGNEVPAILATGSLSQEAVRRDATLGYALLLAKPFGVHELTDLVERVLNSPAG